MEEGDVSGGGVEESSGPLFYREIIRIETREERLSERGGFWYLMTISVLVRDRLDCVSLIHGNKTQQECSASSLTLIATKCSSLAN